MIWPWIALYVVLSYLAAFLILRYVVTPAGGYQDDPEAKVLFWVFSPLSAVPLILMTLADLLYRVSETGVFTRFAERLFPRGRS